jgi:hypothetical protein
MPRDLGLILLAIVCLIGDFVLIVLGHDLPPMLETVTIATAGAAAGATIPRAKLGY